MDFQKSQLNQKFVQMLDDPEMAKEAEQKGAEFLKLQIYEDSFMEKILPAQPISPSQADRTTDAPNYQYVIDKEFTDVGAVEVGLRGLADYDYVEEDRYAVNFWKIESDEYEKTEGEIRGMRQPIQNLIRHHIAYHIRKQMDKSFIGAVNAAISQNTAEQVVETDEPYLTPEHVVDLRNILEGQNAQGRYLQASTLLMTVPQYNKISQWIQQNTSNGANAGPGMAGGITQEFWRDGYEYDTLFGMRVIKTYKSDLIDNDEVYVFTDPQFLGHHLTFNDDRFSIIKHHDRIKWKGWRTFGFAIGNAKACGKLKLDVSSPKDSPTDI